MPVTTSSGSNGNPTATALQSSFVRNTFTLSDGQPREFLWACELTKENPEVTWTFDDEDDDLDYINHTLFLRHAVLGVGATKDERNVVEAETKNYAQKMLKVPLASLTLGQSDMCHIDLNFSHEIPVTFRLIEGDGPVSLSGQHLAEIPKAPEDEDELDYTEGEVTADTEEDAEEEDEEEEEEEEEEASPSKAKKRKGTSLAAKKSKRGKLDSAASTATEEDDDEEDEEDEEESMEEEDDDDEEEEEESSPEKKKKKSAKTTKKPTAKALKAKMKATGGKVSGDNKCSLM